jgi:hypothetical protein
MTATNRFAYLSAPQTMLFVFCVFLSRMAGGWRQVGEQVPPRKKTPSGRKVGKDFLSRFFGRQSPLFF